MPIGIQNRSLFADTPEQGEELFLALVSAAAPEQPAFIDVPEANRAVVTLVERHGMEGAFETARMYRGTAPRMPVERIYGITSFEVG